MSLYHCSSSSLRSHPLFIHRTYWETLLGAAGMRLGNLYLLAYIPRGLDPDLLNKGKAEFDAMLKDGIALRFVGPSSLG